MEYLQKIIDRANQNLVGKELFDEYIIMTFDIVKHNIVKHNEYYNINITILYKPTNKYYALTESLFKIVRYNQIYFYIMHSSSNMIIRCIPIYSYDKRRGYYSYKLNSGELCYDYK